MRITGIAATIGASLALQSCLVCAKHNHLNHNLVDRRHRHHQREAQTSKAEVGNILELRTPAEDVEKRGAQCQFPTNAGLVSITPDQQNAGWAMSPNQPCLPGNYCPYACPPGQMMAQWDPDATSYKYPQSMNGGLYCDKNGNIQKPFPDKPYCVGGTTSIGALNKAGSVVSFCQTVLPGNEAMLIPTSIETWAQLTIPTPDYWCGTAAHFYINPPGVDTDTACVWGSSDNPWGNWSPYVAGGNTDASGKTFIKLAWNPIYLEPATPFKNVMPTWGVEIVCDGPGCNGLPCAIDPSQNQVNEMVGQNADGAGGANFCVVTVPRGVNANFVVFNGGMSHAGGDSGAGAQANDVTPSPTPTPTPTPTTTSTSTPAPPSSTSKSSSSSSSIPSSSAAVSTTAKITSTLTSSPSSYPSFAYSPHVLIQNMTSSYAAATAALTAQSTLPVAATSGLPIPSAKPTGAGFQVRAPAAGLGLSLLAAVMVIAL